MFVLGKHPGGLNTNCLAYSPLGRLVASAKDNVLVWDVQERQEVREIIVRGSPGSVTFAADGRLVVASSGIAPVQIYEPETGHLLREFPYYSWCRAQCALFSNDGEALICGGHSHADGGDKLGRILRWNMKTGRQRWPLLGPVEDIGFAAFSPDGGRLAAGGEKGTAWLWDLKTRHTLATFPSRYSSWRVVAFSPNGRTLAITGGRTVELWDAQTFEQRRILRGHRNTVNGIAFSPDGRLLSGGADGTVRVWDPATGQEQACLDWQIGSVNNVAVAPDGLTAAAGAREGAIVVWDLEA
jgi:WD40 repeat protein